MSHADDGGERCIPFSSVEGISVFGMAQLSTRLIRECISYGVQICYYSDDGHYFGRTTSPDCVNPERQKLQASLTDDGSFCLAWTRRVVEAKLRNSMRLLESQGVAGVPEARGLRHSLESLRYADSVEMAIGFEGNAAKSYFKCLSESVGPEGMRFEGRSTRPPKDPFNSMISYGYSMLYRNVIGAIERHGLHPYFAFMHKTQRGHAALASDLMEDLRAPLVDRTVLELVNSGEVDETDFDFSDEGAVYMRRETIKRLTSALSQVIVRGHPFYSAYGDTRSYGVQVMLDKKMQSVVRAIEEGDALLYRPILWQDEP